MSTVDLNYAQCLLLAKHDIIVRSLCTFWYDGDVRDLFTYKGRYMRRRLVHRAIRETTPHLSPLHYFVAFGMAVHSGNETLDNIPDGRLVSTQTILKKLRTGREKEISHDWMEIPFWH